MKKGEDKEEAEEGVRDKEVEEGVAAQRGGRISE